MAVRDETPTVRSCTKSIISVYHQAGTAFERVKAKYAEKRFPSPPRCLDESIDPTPEEIERELKRGITRFGAEYETGDDEAIMELQQILLHLRSNLLEKLKEVADSDHVMNFMPLIDAANAARDGTIGVLLQLKSRLLQSVPTNDLSNLQSLCQDTPPNNVLSQKGGLPSLPEHAAAGAEEDTDHTRRTHHGSLIGMLKHARHSFEPDSQKPTNDRHYRQSEPLPSPWPNRNGSGQEEDPFGIWKPSQNRDTLHNLSVSPNPSRISLGSSTPTSTRRQSATPSGAPLSKPPSRNPQPNADNNFLGYCKGAARLQTGDRSAFQKTKEFNDGWSHSSVYYLACSNSKCAYASHIDMSVIWDKVWAVDQKGIAFRWPFLAKSHICQKQAKNSEYAYQCLFCVFAGDKPPVIHGTDAYLGHIDEEHRGRVLGDVVMYRSGCIADRIAEENEDFDINLYPLTINEHTQRRNQSDDLSDEVVVDLPKKASDAQDSVIDDEPWCEGLSEIHPSLSIEHGGRRYSLASLRSYGRDG